MGTGHGTEGNGFTRLHKAVTGVLASSMLSVSILAAAPTVARADLLPDPSWSGGSGWGLSDDDVDAQYEDLPWWVFDEGESRAYDGGYGWDDQTANDDAAASPVASEASSLTGTSYVAAFAILVACGATIIACAVRSRKGLGARDAR